MSLKNKINNIIKNFSSHKTSPALAFYSNTFAGINFTGEQEPGALLDPVVYDIDYYAMAEKAYTLFTINEFTKIAVTRLAQFVVGTGLSLHPEPCKRFLKRNFNISIEKDFAKDIQELWDLFQNDVNVSITKQDTLHSLANQVYINALIAGDVLVIKRVIDGNLEYQLVNGLAVYTPELENSKNKNKIRDGVEIDANGKHVAYYIKQADNTIKRVEAYDQKGRPIAWLVYASDKRLNSVRGYSPLGAIMQKLNKIGKYANSEVIAADANARFAAVIEQDKDSSGINPLKGGPVPRGLQNVAPSENNVPNAEVTNFREKLKHFASGIFFHVPKGQKMSSFDTKRPNVNYAAFLDGSMKYIYASLGIPFEIAILLFSNNFSASRAALKIFELIVEYTREYCIINGFYKKVYEQFFELECLKNNINAPDYLKLKNNKGYMDNAYTKAKFIGKKIPHIDEVKEANAIIAKLKAGLITFEQAIASLGNTVNFETMVEQRKFEEDKIKSAGLFFESVFAPVTNEKENNSNNEDQSDE
ncbi:phage portal protein [bacterium]|nr:phage portal protein [bacterium]